MYYFTQEHLNNRFHHAVETSNLHELKYYLSSPDLGSHADVNSLSQYNKPVWYYLSQANETVQDYLISFEYIKDNDIKNAAINHAFTWVCSNHDLYAAQGILKQHKSILTSDALNTALMRAVHLQGDDSIHFLFSQDFPGHTWNNAQAVLVALINNTAYADTILKYDINATHDINMLKSLQHTNRNIWLNNLTTQIEPQLNLKDIELFNKLWSYIGKTGNISLLHYFTHDNRYNINCPIDADNNNMFKSSILNSQYDLVEELMSSYGCRVNDEIKQYIEEFEALLDDNIDEILKNIELKVLLEADLPNNNCKVSKNKI